MKTAVVYYTYDGSTRVAAEALARQLGADVFELEEVKKRGKSALSFMAAGFGALAGKRSRIKNDFAAEMKNYDCLYIGSPVWANKTAPAVNTFLDSLDAAGKKIVLFTLQADPNVQSAPDKCLLAHKQTLEKRGATVLRLLRFHGASPGKTAESEHIEAQLAAQAIEQ
ncbi:MAG: flavodoxin family protein [Christensenellales bacterium]|jgi:flavodoxin